MNKLSLPNFKDAKVLVVGDVMLDKYLRGDSTRISPEAPVPVVKVNKTEVRAGGAANVALNISSLGASSTIIGFVGKDDAALELNKLLFDKSVNTKLVPMEKFPTITKLRVLSKGQQLLRLDFEEGFWSVDQAPILARVRECINDSKVMILSDYGKGALASVQRMIEIAKNACVKVLIDPKGTDFERYRGADLITPNMSEFEAVVGKVTSEEDLILKGRKLIAEFGINSLLVTRSEKGMTLIRKEYDALTLPTEAKEVYDVTGAGDTVIGTLATCLASGMDLPDACSLANKAAGIVVGKVGTSTVSIDELLRTVSYEVGDINIVDKNQLINLVRSAQAKGEKVVMTNGCFDILHAGHVAYLNQAKSLGDRLIVAVNTDESVSRLKGPTRPINSLDQRMAVLAGLAAVDWVVPFGEDTPRELIAEVLPNILVKGGDYKPEDIAGYKEVVENNGEVKVLCFKDNCSTTNIVNKILNQK
ncbi:MAG: bifunctional D-glycero-beta-D-manno-heptose-7-phosphate kinase/D-glycero-beta-D-manno-heptose 1-phosphate adenylyltransferase HldE [Succinivibrionaceae bacterium]